MSSDEVKFGIFPRFYILCYVSEAMSYKFIEMIREKVENQKLKIEGIQFIELIPFKYDTYEVLGAVEIRIQELTLDYMQTIDYNNQTAELYAFSQALEKGIQEVNKSVSEDVFLDHHNPPYLVSIANASTLGEIHWTKENINAHKKSLGRWIEFYSGQFADYSDELFNSRIENNLSNRLSELHYIRLNSAFIYMEREAWLKQYGDYMEKFFINQILRSKALLLSFYVLNLDIDKTNKYLHTLKEPTLKLLQKEVENLQKKKVLIDNLNDQLIKEQMINRRAHSKKTLETCITLFGINFVREETSYKFQRLQHELDNERAEQQQKFANSQKKWLLVLNILLGSSVIFTVVEKFRTNFPYTGPSHPTDIINIIYQNIYNYTESIILFFLILVGAIGAIGLIYNFLKHQVGFSTLFKKIGLNTEDES